MDGIDANIALGVKAPQFESPLNTMANLYQMQNAQQSNQLNKMKMDEYQQGLAEQAQFKNALAGSQDETAIKNAFYGLGEKGVKGYNDYLKSKADQLKSAAETTNLGYTGAKTQADTVKLKAEHGAQMLRDLSSNPSNANVTAHFEDIQNSPLYTPQEKQAAQGRLQEVLAMTVPERQSYLASQGASASDLKPHIQMQNLGGASNVLSVPAYGGAPTTLSSTKVTATPGELLSAATAKEGQNVTLRGQDLINARDLQKIEIEKGKLSPEYIALEAKQKQAGKQSAINEAAMPGVIANATEAIKKIDELVGTAPVVDKAGKVTTPGGKPHPGFSQAVGAGIPGLKYVPGTSVADFNARLEEIQGGAFLEAYNTLKGGGSITEVEGKKATAAITRMSTAQSEKEFKTAARDFQSVLRKGIDRAKAKGGAATTTTTVAPPDGFVPD